MIDWWRDPCLIILYAASRERPDIQVVAAFDASITQTLQWMHGASHSDIIIAVRVVNFPKFKPDALGYRLDFHSETLNFANATDPDQYARPVAVWVRKSTGLSAISYSDIIDAPLVPSKA